MVIVKGWSDGRPWTKYVGVYSHGHVVLYRDVSDMVRDTGSVHKTVTESAIDNVSIDLATFGEE